MRSRGWIRRSPLTGNFHGAMEEAGVGRHFQVLSLVTLFAVFALVVLGGVVRLTESGLGCPDWPLCHGKIIPPMDRATLIEYSHRLMASLVGVLVVVTVVSVWRSYRRRPWLTVPAIAALILLAVQVLLGGVTVLAELPGGVVMAHLATAEVLLASMVVLCLAAWISPRVVIGEALPDWREDRLPLLALAALGAAFVVLLTGSYVTVSGATVSCGTAWPLCQGWLPEGHHAVMHMVHRLMGLLAAGLMVVALVGAWQRRRNGSWLGWLVVLVGSTFVLQVLGGAAILFSDFAVEARLAHLAMASLVWVGLAALVVLLWAPWGARLRSVGGA